MRSLSAPFLVVSPLLHLVVALQVTPGSRCAVLCLDNPELDPNDPKSSTINTDDIVCSDDDYNTSPPGIKFQNCLDCLQTSNATSNTESDTSWFLYNLRYSIDVCLYDFPKATDSKSISSPCDIDWACQPLKTGLVSGITNSSSGTYDFCSADGNVFGEATANDCLRCLQASPNQIHLANFFTALKAGCEQRPGPGALVGLSGSLFTNDLINITNPAASKPQGNGSSSPFTTGAIVGIVVGATLLFLGGSALFYVYHRKQKRLYADPGNLPSYTPWAGGGSIEPKLTTSNHYELRAQGAHTVDYGDPLVKEMQTSHLRDNLNTNKPELGHYGVLPMHPAYVPRAHSRQTSQDSEKPVKKNRPDSYAVRAYLNAAEEANSRSIPPPPPPAALRSSAFQLHSSGQAYDSYNNSASQSRASSLGGHRPSADNQPLLNPDYQQNSQSRQHIQTNQQQLTHWPQLSHIAPPPPPPPASEVPSLGFPSLPKLRVSKRYAPPVIAVQSATPTDGTAHPTQGRVPISNQ
ncbi:hypothetical protein GGR50DRAFT_483452 [Xylaria sp. CBS 124048]|nr:hypothetical protein GGR50DRAFT_483452 [Xylaria sp. CBS 124048]